MNIGRFAAVITVCSFAATAALAQGTTTTPRIDQRQETQGARIQQGVDSGQLNKKETRRLEQGQTRVRKMEDRAAADGTVTKGERARIENAQDRQSARIARQKHDAQKAP